MGHEHKTTRAQQTVEHREIGRKPSARRGQHALHEQAIQAARLRARCEGGKERLALPSQAVPAAANALIALMRHKDIGNQPLMADWCRFRSLPSSECIDAASMLVHAVPMNEPLNTMRSMITASEYLVQLLGEDSIDLPAARSALEEI